jgi:hypothetical protein
VGCNPKFHASWAVAGWFMFGKFPAYGVVVAAGVCKSWRSYSTSFAVRVVVGCGICYGWVGGGAAGVFNWSSGVV